MIVAHLSDLHLGHRAYEPGERARATREHDVAAAFDRAVTDLVRLRPDVVVVAGDVFDRPDPGTAPLVTLARGLETLRAGLPGVPVLVVAGVRDTPRQSGEAGVLEAIDTLPHVEAATETARSVLLDGLSLHVVLLPHAALAGGASPPPPDPRARFHVLVTHARMGGEGAVAVDAAGWDYVALGHEHRFRKVADRVVYSGSLERVGPEPWSEAAEEKGFVTVDLATGRVSFHRVGGRAVVALAPIRVSGGAASLPRRVREVTGEVPGGIEDKIVRLTLQGVGARDLLQLQGDPLASLRTQALHLVLEVEPPRGNGSGARDPFTSVRDRLAAVGAEPTGVIERLEALATRGPGAGARGRAPAVTVRSVRLAGVPRLGSALLEPGSGLVAITGGGGGVRGLLEETLRRGMRRGPPLPGGGEVEVDLEPGGREPLPDGWIRLWGGEAMDTLEGALAVAAGVLAGAAGAERIDAALAALSGGTGARAGGEAPPPSSADLRERRRVLDDAREDLREGERALTELRADHVEASGDLDAATMEWLRERQDAETRLQAYRDRARELRTHLAQLDSTGPEAACPTCGRPLEEHIGEVLARLQEEWEAVVQDGIWWRKRRGQLELKPANVRELEGRVLRLQAAIEACAERAERVRLRVEELDGRGEARAGEPAAGVGEEPGGAEAETPDRALVRALEAVRDELLAEARERVLERAAALLMRVSAGSILGVWPGRDGSLRLEGATGPLDPPAVEDVAAALLALRVAGASLAREAGAGLGSLLIGDAFDRLEEETELRAAEILRRLALELGQVLLLTRGDAVDQVPEAFDAVLELRRDPGEGWSVARLPTGVARIRLARA